MSTETGQKEGPLAELERINAQLRELARCQQRAMFEARMRGQLDQALTITGMSRKQGLALTRAENEQRGRVVRWGDL